MWHCGRLAVCLAHTFSDDVPAAVDLGSAIQQPTSDDKMVLFAAGRSDGVSKYLLVPHGMTVKDCLSLCDLRAVGISVKGFQSALTCLKKLSDSDRHLK